MKLSGDSASVWPGYVAAVASLLLSLLLLAGVLVVAISQIGRVVGNYNGVLMLELIEDEKRSTVLEELNKKDRDLAMALLRAGANAASQETPEQQQERALDVQLLQKEADMAAAQAELVRVNGMFEQASESKAQPPQNKTLRFAFGAGAQGMDERAAKELRASLAREDLLARRWVLESGAQGLSVSASREAFRLMNSLRTQLREMGLPADQVRLVLNPERSPQDLAGSMRSGETVIILRPDAKDRAPS